MRLRPGGIAAVRAAGPATAAGRAGRRLPLFVLLLLVTLVTFGIGALLTVPVGILIGIAWLVFTIIAAVKANEGERYRYPFTLRLIK